MHLAAPLILSHQSQYSATIDAPSNNATDRSRAAAWVQCSQADTTTVCADWTRLL